MNAEVDMHLYDGLGHEVNEQEIEIVSGMLERLIQT